MKDKLAAINVFIQVCDTGGFASAANKLGLTPTKVSRLVKALEASLGVRLLNRTTRRISLTEAGERYLMQTRNALAQLDEADRIAQRQASVPTGRLRVNAPLSFGVRQIAPRLGDFLTRYPSLAIDLSLDDRYVDPVEAGFDLTVRIGMLTDSSLISQRIAEAELVLCASPAYIAQSGEVEQFSDLTDHACLCYGLARTTESWTFRHSTDDAVETLEIVPRFRANNGDAVLAMALSGAGIAYQPSFIVNEALADGSLIRLMPDWQGEALPVQLLYAHRDYQPARSRLFADFLRQAFKRDQNWTRLRSE